MTEIITFLEEYQKNEPIFIEDIIAGFPTRSRQWIDHELNILMITKKLKRYMTGVYYIPSGTKLDNIKFNIESIVTTKYIQRKGNTFGYYSGDTLLSKLGLVTRRPDIVVIVSNKEKSRGRKVVIGDRQIYLIKAPTEITNNNYRTLTFLEAVRLLDFINQNKWVIDKLANYINHHNVTLSQVQKYCTYFPDVVSKKILSSSLIHDLFINQRYPRWFDYRR